MCLEAKSEKNAIKEKKKVFWMENKSKYPESDSANIGTVCGIVTLVAWFKKEKQNQLLTYM